jgi:hypothetical protein
MTQQNQARLLIFNRVRLKHHPIPIFVLHQPKMLAKPTHRY